VHPGVYRARVPQAEEGSKQKMMGYRIYSIYSKQEKNGNIDGLTKSRSTMMIHTFSNSTDISFKEGM
jgi:hypothetical protein